MHWRRPPPLVRQVAEEVGDVDMAMARSTSDGLLRRGAAAAALLSPLAFLYTRGGSEVLIGVVDALFLARCVLHRRWSWLRRPWMAAALAWWSWMILASTPIAALGLGESGWHSWGQSLAMGRFFLFAAALADWLLLDRDAERRLGWSVSATAAWIGLQCWEQYLLGANIFGWPRWGDGALTGPFRGPRAGPPLVLLLFPAMLPPVMRLLRQPGAAARLLAAAIAVSGVATMILIGQRMPALLTLLGLLSCGVLIRQLRLIVLATLVIGAALLAATPVLSPPTFDKLVLRFSAQVGHFSETQYGLLYIRAAVMTLDHPLTGLGFDGFRQNCDDPRYQRGLPELGVRDADAAGPLGCSLHPHNHYLEAATAGGLPGLLLFSAMVLAWLITLGRGLFRDPEPRRVGLFTSLLIALWPLASTSAFFTLPNAGWMFLLLGWGVARSARWHARDGPTPP